MNGNFEWESGPTSDLLVTHASSLSFFLSTDFTHFLKICMQRINGRKKSAERQRFHLQIPRRSHAEDAVNTTPCVYTSTPRSGWKQGWELWNVLILISGNGGPERHCPLTRYVFRARQLSSTFLLMSAKRNWSMITLKRWKGYFALWRFAKAKMQTVPSVTCGLRNH